MLTEFLLALIPPAGGIIYTLAKKKGYNDAIEKARREAQADLKAEIGMREYEDHLRQVPDHICGETCRVMMRYKIDQANRKPAWYEKPGQD